MEDSGYLTRPSTTELRLSGTSSKLTQPDGIFSVSFNELRNNPNYSYLRHGFDDEKDFEDFKQELRDFRRIKQELAANYQESTRVIDKSSDQDSCNFSYTDSNTAGVPKPLPRSESTFRNYRDCYKELPVCHVLNGIAANIRDSSYYPDPLDISDRGLTNGKDRAEVEDYSQLSTKSYPSYSGLKPQFSHSTNPRPQPQYRRKIDKSGINSADNNIRHDINGNHGNYFSIPSQPRNKQDFQTEENNSIVNSQLKTNSPGHKNQRSCVSTETKSDLKTNLSQCRFSSLARKKLKEDFQDFKLSGLSGLLSRRRRDKSIMEPCSFDDHFQEFERVYETIHSRRTSVDMDIFKHPIDDSDEDEGIPLRARGLSRFSSKSSLNDVFSIDFDDAFLDFFNTDEDFVEFEREFERSRLNRRSRAISDFKRLSSCDIFSDVKSFCDRNKILAATSKDDLRDNSPSDDLDEGQSSCTDLERVNSAEGKNNGDNNSDSCNMWNSLEEWDYVLNKLKRNSRMFTDSADYWDIGASDGATNRAAESCMCKSSKDCQYTCHHTCVPSVTLDCTSVSPTEVPSTPDGSAAETSLSDRRRNVATRPQIPAILEEKVTNDQDPATSASATTPLLPPSLENEQSLDPAHENDETDSGYRSGTIPDEKLPKHKGEATLNREELKRKVDAYNLHVPSADFEPDEGGETFQGFLKVTLNFIRPITMSLGVRPPSIYEMLTKEHIVEQNTQSIAFYMPRDTVKSIHTSSTATTKEVIAALLKKFHIIDHPRKFAMYEQEFDGHKIVKLRRVMDKEYPLAICLDWDTEHLKRYRLVIQENETGEIVWDGFSLPELKNFLTVLGREENEYISQLQYKYKIMRRIITQRLKELRKERRAKLAASPTGSSSPSSPRSSGGFTPPNINSPGSASPASKS